MKKYKAITASLLSLGMLVCVGCAQTSEKTEGGGGEGGGSTSYISIDYDGIRTHGGVILKKSDVYVKPDADDFSIAYTPTGTWTFMNIATQQTPDWENAKLFSLWVYNPSEEYDYYFGITLRSCTDLEFCDHYYPIGNAVYRAEADGWTQIEIAGKGIREAYAQGCQYLRISMSYPDNGGAQSEQWKNAKLYFDAFQLTTL